MQRVVGLVPFRPHSSGHPVEQLDVRNEIITKNRVVGCSK